MRFDVVDGCPVPSKTAPAVRAIRREFHRRYDRWPQLNSCYRGNNAARLLKRLGKHTQAFLYAMFLRHVPGYAPANPPTYGTHVLRSDGVAYRGPKGRPLLQWQVGFDWDNQDVPGVMKVARDLGMPMRQPYPAGSEYHHTNFIHRPPRRYYR
jgi:hypothetical protein